MSREASASPQRTERASSKKAVTAQLAGSPAVRPVAIRQGLGATPDELALNSAVALVIDPETGDVLYEKNPQAVLPIASITKLMTAMVVLDAKLPLDETIAIGIEDSDSLRHTASRLAIGAKLSRRELLHLALMASENRAAHALGRNYPGGLTGFVAAMNAKALQLGMTSARFVDPTGLSSGNIASSRDLVAMAGHAHTYAEINEFSTTQSLAVEPAMRTIEFRTTNRLVNDPSWNIALQKTGYIGAAGRCLVMLASIQDRPVLMVLMAAAGNAARAADANRIRDWLTARGGFSANQAMRMARSAVSRNGPPAGFIERTTFPATAPPL
jgi:D-alanyl-D-alanine endopeptidase (penicillin-binding protein 7)